MPIDFHCSTCGKLLRVPDGTAGQQARCPHCGAVAVIPSPGASQPGGMAQPFGGDPSYGAQPTASGALRPDDANPFASPASAVGHAPFDPAFALEEARGKLFGPALSLMILSVVSAAVLVLILVSNLAQLAAERNAGGNHPVAYMLGYFLPYTISLALLILIFFGAWQMKNLRSYGMSMTAAILALLPCNCCFMLTIPFGIWALIVLMSDEVKWGFERVGGR